jgi:predicted RecB family nuclease
MRAVAHSLVRNLGQAGSIFMYRPFERHRMTDLIGMFPDLSPRLKALKNRLVDLHPIVKKHYYHPDMKGSWSLKAVTTCIAPEMSLANLGEVADGMAAQRAYLEIIAPETNDVRRENLRQKLLDYCKLDTMAMVKIAEILQGK